MRILRDEDVRAWVAEDDPRQGRVLVIPADHARANEILATRMEDVQRLAERLRESSGERHEASAEPAARPLVMERFASMGWLVGIVLAPLLVVTLAQTVQSRTVVIAVLALGVVAVVVGRLWSRRR